MSTNEPTKTKADNVSEFGCEGHCSSLTSTGGGGAVKDAAKMLLPVCFLLECANISLLTFKF